MCVRVPSVPARTLGEVCLDEGNFGASHTRCADVAICWCMLRFLGRARSCKCRRPPAILGQKAGHPVDVGVEARPASTCGHARLLEAPGRLCNAFADRIDPDVLAGAHANCESICRVIAGTTAFGGSTCRINQPSSLHMAFGPMGHVTARSFRCSWPMAFR